MSSPLASIVITSKNRRDELRQAIQSALSQSVPVEVIVVSDGATDGTPEMVRSEFPSVRLFAADRSQGYIVQRNRGAIMASAPVIVSIDDDAALVNPRTVEQTLAEFDRPRIGAVAMPFINVKYDKLVRQHAPDERPVWLTGAYIGTAHAVRRDVFLSVGGYLGPLFSQAEERDFCLRMLDHGYVVRLGRAEPLHHFESPRRSKRAEIHYRSRNHLLLTWRNVPMPYMPAHWLANHWSVMRMGLRLRHPLWAMQGLLAGYAGCVGLVRRDPVSRKTYRLSRRLGTAVPVTLEDVESCIEPMRPIVPRDLTPLLGWHP